MQIHTCMCAAELTAILMALYYIIDLPFSFFQVLFCVDSKSALYSLSSTSYKKHCNIVSEICHLIHRLSLVGTNVNFCWVPSHLGFLSNEWADRAAKKGANSGRGSSAFICPLSISEIYRLLERETRNHIKILHNDFDSTSETSRMNIYNFHNVFSEYSHYRISRLRQIVSLVYRIKLNAFKTKFVKGIRCCCGREISCSHILFECKDLKPVLPHIPVTSLTNVLNDF